MKRTDPDFNPNLAFQIISRGHFTPAFPCLLYFSSSFVFQLSCFCIPDLLLNRLFAPSTICSLLSNSFHISILGWCRSCRHNYPIRSSSFFWPVLRIFWEVLWCRGNAGCKKVPATILIMLISYVDPCFNQYWTFIYCCNCSEFFVCSFIDAVFIIIFRIRGKDGLFMPF